ncbi:MAG TPA: ribonuclease HI family protein [Acidobacteriaceae bacterium]
MTESSKTDFITAYCDGGSRGNPGPAGYGVSIEDPAGRPVADLSEFLGVKTNNFAEYSGLLAALEYALRHGHPRLRVVADSELMVKQMKGQYQVKSPDLRPLWEEAKRRATRLEKFEIQHVLRGKNKRADALANQAMDRGTGRTVRDLSREDSNSPSIPVRPTKPAEKRTLKGFVKNGVVHLLEGELPENCFVRVTVE